MPSADTFDIAPIGDLVQRYLAVSQVSIDPFARNKQWATYTNDLNPETAANSHVDVAVFLCGLLAQGVRVDLVIFDPPYSPRQIKECYDGIGLKMGGEEAWRAQRWTKERAVIDRLLVIGGVVVSCGWNSVGMGRSYQRVETLLVCHGAGHNDTIVVVDRKISNQEALPL